MAQEQRQKIILVLTDEFRKWLISISNSDSFLLILPFDEQLQLLSAKTDEKNKLFEYQVA